MPQLARRLSRAKPSAIMAVAEKAKRLKADVLMVMVGVVLMATSAFGIWRYLS